MINSRLIELIINLQLLTNLIYPNKGIKIKAKNDIFGHLPNLLYETKIKY